MNVYIWSMHRASVILFIISLVLFLIGFGQSLLVLKNGVHDTIIGGEPVSAGLASFLVLLGGTFGALSSAAIPFIGAVVAHRWDQR